MVLKYEKSITNTWFLRGTLSERPWMKNLTEPRETHMTPLVRNERSKKKLNNHLCNVQLRKWCEFYFGKVRYSVNPHRYLAERLHEAIFDYEEPDLPAIDRIIIGRAEVDLAEIALYYRHRYSRYLCEDLKVKWLFFIIFFFTDFTNSYNRIDDQLPINLISPLEN